MKRLTKIKKRRSNSTIFLLSIVLIFITSGYALLSETINISGTASTNAIVEGPNLEINLISSGGNYTQGAFSGMSLTNETYDNLNNLSTYFTKSNRGNGVSSNTLTVNFSNSYPINMISGQISSQVISGSFTGVSASLTKTALTPGESASFSLNFSHRNKTVGSGQILVTIIFISDGAVQSFYYRVYVS